MIAVVYDGAIRDTGTPRLFREAFAEVLGRDVDWFTQAKPIPGGYDFYFHLDDGRDDLKAVPPGPWGYYATDTHLGFEPRRDKARQAAITWCAQRPAAEALKAEGVNAKWLPLACSPRHHPTAVEVAAALDQPLAEKEYDFAFVGHLQPSDQSDRIAFLDALRSAGNFRYEFSVFGVHMARVYHRAKIGLNHAVRDDLNMRFFELASMGVPQLCDARMDGMQTLGYREFQHYIPYRSTDEASSWVEKLRGERETLAMMASNALSLVRSQDTYVHRVRTMIRDAEELTGKTLNG